MAVVSPSRPGHGYRRRRRVIADQRGATILEFAFVAPVLALLLVGAMDVGHSLYMRSVLQGVVQKAARDSGLERAEAVAVQAALDAKVKESVLVLYKNAEVETQRRYYRSFETAAAARMEPFTDTNGDGICNKNEPFEDENNNGTRDLYTGNSGQGGAKDSVVYTVTVRYPRMFPLHNFISVVPANVTLRATTVLQNQPYGDQTPPSIGNCK